MARIWLMTPLAGRDQSIRPCSLVSFGAFVTWLVPLAVQIGVGCRPWLHGANLVDDAAGWPRPIDQTVLLGQLRGLRDLARAPRGADRCRLSAMAAWRESG